MSSSPKVAILGASGHIGFHIAQAFASNSSAFKEVRLLTRNSTEAKTRPKLQDLVKDGSVNLVTYDEQSETSILNALKGVDILVNVIGSEGHHFKEILSGLLPQTSVKLYFPSEFGVDHTVHDFSHPEWDAKKVQSEILHREAPHIKISHIYTSLILEDSIGPLFGFDTKNHIYEAVGSADALISFTALDDVGRVVVALAKLPIQDVPEHIHVQGDSKSISQIAALMERESADGQKIEVRTIEYEPYRTEVLKLKGKRPAYNMRYLIADRKLDHTTSGLGNDNELINPGESNWKWKTVEDLARETKGRPVQFVVDF